MYYLCIWSRLQHFYIHVNTVQSFLNVSIVFRCDPSTFEKRERDVPVLMLEFKLNDKMRGNIVVSRWCSAWEVCVSSESWVLFSLVSDPSHAYITSLIRQSMISLEGGKMWREKNNNSVMLKDLYWCFCLPLFHPDVSC